MFTILQKRFAKIGQPFSSSDRVSQRYFKNWESAKNEMLKSIESCCKTLDGKVVEKYDYFNSAKGFYVFEQKAHFPNGEYCVWALLDGYFEDEE